MIWVYVVLAILFAIAIWLAIAVIKWLFILAVIVAAIWAFFWVRHRVRA